MHPVNVLATLIAPLTLVILLLSGGLAQADFSRSTAYQPQGEVSRFEQRRRYQESMRHIKNGQRQRYVAIRQDLQSYPLFPYLEFTDKIYNLWQQKPEDIDTFLTQYADTPLAYRLRENYLFALGKRGDWQRFIDFYGGDSRDINRCFYATALAKTGDSEGAAEMARQLWLKGKSQPDECDPVFRWMRDQDLLTDELAWQRFVLAMEAGKRKLAAYLVRFLPEDAKPAATAYQQFRSNSRNLRQTRRYTGSDERMADAILYGVRRAARRDAAESFDLLDHYQGQLDLSPGEIEETQIYVARRLAGEGDPGERMATLPADIQAHPEVLDARLRLALVRQDYAQVEELVAMLPPALGEEPRWQFWLAMSQIYRGSNDNNTDVLLSQLATLRNFYGFLAADYLEQPYQFVNEPGSVSEEEILAMEATPGMQRAYELLTIGQRQQARSEWYFLTREFSNRERLIAARVAHRWGWHKSAIQVLIDAEAWNELDLRFPVAYQDLFLQNARAAEIPVNWSLAVARQESAFMPDAHSHAGARGLMQLMPNTAQIVAKGMGESFSGEQQLSDPVYNIQLGSQYLGRMLRRYNNNRVLASAAYNAGPARVDKWRNENLPLEAWIEVIPFRETRAYVQNVLMFSAIYARQLGQQQPLIYPHEFREFGAPYFTQRGETETGKGWDR